MGLCTNGQISHLVPPTPLQACFTKSTLQPLPLTLSTPPPLSPSSWCCPSPPDPLAPEPTDADPLTPSLSSPDARIRPPSSTSPPSPTPSLSLPRRIRFTATGSTAACLRICLVPSSKEDAVLNAGGALAARFKFCLLISPIFITISEFSPI